MLSYGKVNNLLEPCDATMDASGLYVISVCTNPVRYQSRYTLFTAFQKRMADLGANLLTVECAFGDRPYVVTERHNPMHLRFRTDSEIWHKENLINLGIQYLSLTKPDWQYVAWIDGDVSFQRPDILVETVHQLQHYNVVQMFQTAVDMGPNGEMIASYNSFMYNYFQNDYHAPHNTGRGGYYGAEKDSYWHPGYAWAARRDAIGSIGLIDQAILGAADHHMAHGLVGNAHRSLPGNISGGYKQMVMHWQRMANFRIRRNVGYVAGMLTHYFHGAKTKRKYSERWQILEKYQFSPSYDLVRDEQGLYFLADLMEDRSLRMRDEIRRYFRERDEDSKDM